MPKRRLVNCQSLTKTRGGVKLSKSRTGKYFDAIRLLDESAESCGFGAAPFPTKSAGKAQRHEDKALTVNRFNHRHNPSSKVTCEVVAQ